MGNQLAAQPVDYRLHDLQAYVQQSVLGGGRFLKSLECRHDEGHVVVKIYFKGGRESLQKYESMLKEQRSALPLRLCPNAIPWAKFLETPRAGYLVRQFFKSNLRDRINTMPFLTELEKLWIAYQLLCGVQQCHAQGIVHGDIKMLNVMVTTWDWVYLTDFAPFKPAKLPEDNPADFSFYFDTSSERTCYLAPERFCDSTSAPSLEVELQPAMDIFSLGCVIAELFREGSPVFGLAEVLAYRQGRFDPATVLSDIEPASIRDMVTHMLQLDPSLRLSAAEYLEKWTGDAFPPYFRKLHSFLQTVISLDPDEKIAAVGREFPAVLRALGVETDTMTAAPGAHQSGRGDVLRELRAAPVANSDSDTLQLLGDTKRFVEQLHTPSRRSQPQSTAPTPAPPVTTAPMPVNEWEGLESHGLIMLASVVCVSLRNVRSAASKVRALELLTKMAAFLNDSIRLQRLLPYQITMLSDPVAFVRAKAVRTITALLCLVQTVPLSEARVFVEYVLPAMQLLPSDSDDAVRIAMAECLGLLAEAGRRFLETAQALPTDAKESVYARTVAEENAAITYEADLTALLQGVLGLVQPFVTDTNDHVKRALLSDITRLCSFFGLVWTNDYLLPMLITFLNDKSWELRWMFFNSIVGVSAFVGRASLRSFLLPCITQALNDEEEYVIEKALRTLSSLAELGLFYKGALLEISAKCVALLCHPNTWIRYAVVAYLVAASKKLSLTDVHCFMLPVISPFLAHPISVISELTLLEATHGPVSRKSYDSAVMSLAEWMAGGRREARQPIQDPISVEDEQRLRLMEEYMRSAAMSLHSRMRTNDDEQARLLPPSIPIRGALMNDNIGRPIDFGTLCRLEGQTVTTKPYTGDTLNNWRPRGIIVANFTEHRAAVNSLALSRDNMFFVSGSDDGTIKVWDCQRLERNVTNHSRLTYTAQGGRITSVALCENSHSVVSGSTNGSVHVFRIDCSISNQVHRYNSFSQIAQLPSNEGAVLFVGHYNTLSESLVLYATQAGRIHAWDLRNKKESWVLQLAGNLGLITSMTVDPQHLWLLVGTRRGFLQLWDLRFLIPVSTWRHPSCAPINKIVLSSSNIVSRHIVFIASGDREVSAWDLASAKCQLVFRSAQSPNTVIPVVDAGPEPAAGDYAVQDLQEAREQLQPSSDPFVPAGRHDGCPTGALYVAQDSGFVVTGGEDRKLRYWDLRTVSSSFVVSGASQDELTQYTSHKQASVTVFQELQTSDVGRQQQPVKTVVQPRPLLPSSAHQDSITDLIGIEYPLRMLASCGRDGVIKVWK